MNPPSPDPSTGTVAVVLAAGLGTRMKSAVPKVLHPLCGRPMLAYVLDAWASTADGSSGRHPIVVFSPPVAAVIDVFADRATFALQDEPRGTGHAVGAALAVVPADAVEVLVLSGDVPLVTGADLDAVLEARRQDDAAVALASVFAADPAELGRVVRGEFGTVERIVEAKDATPDELAGNETNAGIYAFDADWLRRRIGALTPSPATGELYLTDLVRLAREDGRIVSAVAFEDDGRFDGINDRSQLAAAEWSMRVRLNEAHMRNGVTMRDPSTVYLDWTVDLGADVVLEPNVILRGATRVGDGSVIGAGSQLIDATIGAGARVWASVVESSVVEDEASVGPYSHLRPGSVVGRGAAVGNFAELKNTRLGRGLAPAPHELPRRCRGRRGGQHRRGLDHRQLRRGEQAPDDHRRRRVHRRRHDDRRAARHRRGRPDRRRCRGHPRRPARQARRRRPGPDPRAARAKPAATTPEPGTGETRPARWTRSSRSSSSSS